MFQINNQAREINISIVITKKHQIFDQSLTIHINASIIVNLWVLCGPNHMDYDILTLVKVYICIFK